MADGEATQLFLDGKSLFPLLFANDRAEEKSQGAYIPAQGQIFGARVTGGQFVEAADLIFAIPMEFVGRHGAS